MEFPARATRSPDGGNPARWAEINTAIDRVAAGVIVRYRFVLSRPEIQTTKNSAPVVGRPDSRISKDVRPRASGFITEFSRITNTHGWNRG